VQQESKETPGIWQRSSNGYSFFFLPSIKLWRWLHKRNAVESTSKF